MAEFALEWEAWAALLSLSGGMLYLIRALARARVERLTIAGMLLVVASLLVGTWLRLRLPPRALTGVDGMVQHLTLVLRILGPWVTWIGLRRNGD